MARASYADGDVQRRWRMGTEPGTTQSIREAIMSPTKVLGGIFVALLGLELLGLVALQGVGADPNAARSVLVATLGLAWIVGVWATLVAFMVFIIAWVAEGMAADAPEAAVHVASPTAAAPASDARPSRPQLLPKAS